MITENWYYFTFCSPSCSYHFVENKHVWRHGLLLKPLLFVGKTSFNSCSFTRLFARSGSLIHLKPVINSSIVMVPPGNSNWNSFSNHKWWRHLSLFSAPGLCRDLTNRRDRSNLAPARWRHWNFQVVKVMDKPKNGIKFWWSYLSFCPKMHAFILVFFVIFFTSSGDFNIPGLIEDLLLGKLV